jgi:trimethyllysine dioxygenase
LPATPKATEALCAQIGLPHETQYGRFWDFTVDMAKGDMAYTTLVLGAPTDTIYFVRSASRPLNRARTLTRVRADAGGTSLLLVDGFHAASILRAAHPVAHAAVACVPVPAHAAAEPGALDAAAAPVIALDARGALARVRWKPHDRSVLGRGLSPRDVEEW